MPRYHYLNDVINFDDDIHDDDKYLRSCNDDDCTFDHYVIHAADDITAADDIHYAIHDLAAHLRAADNAATGDDSPRHHHIDVDHIVGAAGDLAARFGSTVGAAFGLVATGLGSSIRASIRAAHEHECAAQRDAATRRHVDTR